MHDDKASLKTCSEFLFKCSVSQTNGERSPLLLECVPQRWREQLMKWWHRIYNGSLLINVNSLGACRGKCKVGWKCNEWRSPKAEINQSNKQPDNTTLSEEDLSPSPPEHHWTSERHLRRVRFSQISAKLLPPAACWVGSNKSTDRPEMGRMIHEEYTVWGGWEERNPAVSYSASGAREKVPCLLISEAGKWRISFFSTINQCLLWISY